ncbi:MAG: hypothetical protein Alpg2KO_31620 [Alphaproteobacteria bacterium]
MIGGGLDYCQTCAADGAPCADGRPGLDGQLCPLHDLPKSNDACQVLDLVLTHAPLLAGKSCAAELDRLARLEGLGKQIRRLLVPAAAIALLQGRADAQQKDTP